MRNVGAFYSIAWQHIAETFHDPYGKGMRQLRKLSIACQGCQISF
jgi:hypothetical protein